jgi:hypothetical protein
VHIQKTSAIFALNRTKSAAKGTELNYFVAVIITSHRIFTFPETCYIERTNSNGTARNVSKSRFYLISRAPPKYFSQQKARQVEIFLPRLEGGYTISWRKQTWWTENFRRSRKMMKETTTVLWMVLNFIARPMVMVMSHTRVDGMIS